MSSQKTFSIERRGDGVAVLWMDVPNETLNTLKADFASEVDERLDELAADAHVKAVVLGSKKKGCFIAGADVEALSAVKSESEAELLSRQGQRVAGRFETFPKPIVAAIDGVALGGGLEIALACHARIASSADATKLGLPEAMLGLLPGMGGTQRLPRRIGVQAALDLMLSGRRVSASKARKLGLVDDVVRPSVLVEVAAREALRRVEAPPARERARLGRDALMELALAKNPVGRKVLFEQARKRLHRETRGLYPAQDKILDVVRVGLEQGFDPGLDAEARAFGELVTSPESAALRSLFFATTALKKDRGVDDPSIEPRPVHAVGVLGAGLMGGGIAYVTAALAGAHVRLKDKDEASVRGGLRYVRGVVDGRVRRRSMSPAQADALMATITATTDYSGFGDLEVVIEAVFEDLALKQQMVRDVESRGRSDVIFASNTSSLPITKIAEASAHPETLIGMHYFSPVHKMPLLEVVVTEKTAPWVTATCVELGKRQGKHVIVVKDAPGFYTTRVLAPMLMEAAEILAEGAPIDEIDDAMLDWGFRVGPMKLADEVGLDVGAKIGVILSDAFGERFAAPRAMQKVYEDGRKGRKNQRGFYLYGGKKKGPDESVYELLGLTPRPSAVAPAEIQRRCGLRFVNEAAHCFGEGIVRSARDGDIGAVFGLAFPAFLGGPFRFVDRLGANEVVRRLEELHAKHGARFAPAPVLVEMAREGGTFYGGATGRSRGGEGGDV